MSFTHTHIIWCWKIANWYSRYPFYWILFKFHVLFIEILFSLILQIDWYDPWLITLILAHIGTTTTAICTRNHSLFQVILFLVLCKWIFWFVLNFVSFCILCSLKSFVVFLFMHAWQIPLKCQNQTIKLTNATKTKEKRHSHVTEINWHATDYNEMIE